MGRIGAPRFHLGTQGWNYPAWVGPFYPRSARTADFLPLYARLFDTVEVDSTYYAIPPASTIESWTRRTPPSFRFSLKFPSEATHDDRLMGPRSRDTLHEFTERVRPLGTRLGPILIQMPPDFGIAHRFDLESFLDELPEDLSFAVELRDPAWYTEEMWDSLAARRVAATLIDHPSVPFDTVLALADRPTADFTYVRWLGARDLTDYSRVQLDRTEELTRWAAALPPLLDRGLDVYGYFNNHYAGHSPASARAFMEMVGLEPRNPSDLAPQGELF